MEKEKKVCVITGGGSGMGLEAAKCMPRDRVIIISGRTLAKLEVAAAQLKEMGFQVYPHTCDTSNREDVRALAEFAAKKGIITNVINAAGVSPAMADPETLFRINALGTVYVNEEFSKLMGKGSVILDISSNSAYILPAFMERRKAFMLADTEEALFLKKMIRLSSLPRDAYQKRGFAYALSKKFVIWYARRCAYEYAPKGIRVLSLSPGLVATDMGSKEKEAGKDMITESAEGRMGLPTELGFAIASAADERNGYLAGVDILVDGGAINRKRV